MNKIRPLKRSDNLSNSSMFFNRLSSDVWVYEYLLLCRFISNLTTGCIAKENKKQNWFDSNAPNKAKQHSTTHWKMSTPNRIGHRTFVDALISVCSSFCDVINGTRHIGSGSYVNCWGDKNSIKLISCMCARVCLFSKWNRQKFTFFNNARSHESASSVIQ